MAAASAFPDRIGQYTQASAQRYSARSTATARFITIPVALRSLQEVAMEAFRTFADMIRDVPSVEQVRAQFAGTYLHIVTYASNSSTEQRRQIYQAEMQLADRYRELHFEFDLVDRRGQCVLDRDEPDKWIERIRQLPDACHAIQ